MKKRIGLSVGAVFGCVVSFALPALAAEADFTPAAVGCFPNGECFIGPTANVPSTMSSCANRDQIRFFVSSTNPGATEMYRTALSAFLAGRKLTIAILSTCTASGYPIAQYLFVK